jgi:tetratricopeptide (TPR) repeat protein
MTDRAPLPVENALLANPFNPDPYATLAQEVVSGALPFAEALEVLTRVVGVLAESNDVTRVVPLFSGVFEAALPVLSDPGVKREVLEGIARAHEEILNDNPTALAFRLKAYQLAPDAASARHVGLLGMAVHGDEWALPYLEHHVREAVEPDPVVMIHVAEITMQHDQLWRARQLLELVAVGDPEDPMAGEYLDALAHREAAIQEEVASLRKLVEEGAAEDMGVHLSELARYCFMLEEDSREGADALLRAVQQHGVKAPAVLSQLAGALERTGREAELADVLERRVDGEKDRDTLLDLHRRLAALYAGPLKDPRRARKFLEAASLINPRDPWVMRLLETLYMDVGEVGALVEYLEKALKGVTDTEQEVAILQRLGVLYWKSTADLRNAERVYKRLRQLAPTLLEPLDFYQELYIQQKKYDNIFSIFSHKAEILSGEKLVEAAREVESLTQTVAGSPEKLLEIWKKVVRKEPNHPYAAERYSELLEQMGRWHSVIDFLKTRLKALGDVQVEDKIDLLLRIVDIFGDPHKLNMEDMCTNTYREVLDLDPGNTRAIDALVERYRASGRLKELARILLRKAGVTSGKKARLALLREALEIATDRARDADTALEALEGMHELDRGEAEVSNQLKAAYRQRKDHTRLFRLLREELQTVTEPAARKETLLELARMAQEQLSDADETIRLLEEAAALDPDDEKLVARLEAMFRKAERWGDYARLLRGRLERTTDEAQKVNLLDKLGKICLEKLEDMDAAEGVYLELLRLRPSKILTQTYLERIYLRTRNWDKLSGLFAGEGNWNGYVSLLTEHVERTEGAADKLPPLLEVARVWRERLNQQEGERKTLEKVVELDPACAEALERLREIYTSTHDDAALARVLKTMLPLLADAAQQVETLKHLVVLKSRSGDRDGARGLLLDNLEALVRGKAAQSFKLVRGLLDTPQMVEDYRERLTTLLDVDLPDDGRVFLLEELATLYAEVLHDDQGAAAFLTQVLDLAPGHAGATRKLGALYERQGLTDELTGLLAGSLAHEADPQARAAVHVRLAEIAEDVRGDHQGAVREYLEALEEAPGQVELFEAIERLYAEHDRWDDLADLYLRRIDAAPDEAARASLKLSLAQVLITQLKRVDDALDLLIPLCEGSAQADEAQRLVEELYFNDAERDRSYPFLAAHYEASGAWERLARLLEQQFAASGEAELLLRLAEVHEARFQEDGAALDALLRYVRLQADDGEQWDRLAVIGERAGRFDDLFAEYSRALGQVDGEGERITDGVLANRVLLKQAALARDQLGDLDLACVLFERYREQEPDDVSVLDELMRIKEATEDRAALIALTEQKLDLTWEPDAKRAILRRLCELLDQEPGREADLVEHYHTLLGMDPGDAEVLRALDGLLERQERWEDLAQLVREREVPAATDQAARVSVLVRLAGVQWLRLEAPSDAVETLLEALGLDRARHDVWDLLEELLDAGDADLKTRVIESLEPVYSEAGEHARLAHLVLVKAEASEDAFERAGLKDRVAALFEQALEDPARGLDLRLQALSDHPTPERLTEVYNRAGVLGQWHELAAALKELLEQPGVALDAAAAFLLGEVYLAHLDDRAAAASWFELVVEAEPANLKALEHLRDICHDLQRTEREVQVLAALIDLEADPRKRRELHLHAAELEWERDRLAKAEDHLRRVLELGESRADEEAEHCYTRLRELYHRQGNLEELIDVLRERQSYLGTTEEKKENLYEVAGLYKELKRPADAVDAYREILVDDWADVAARNSIEGLLLETEQWADYEGFLREMLDRSAGDERLGLLRKLGTFYLYYASAPADALQTFEQILEADPHDAETLDALVSLLQDQGVRVEALAFLERFARGGGQDELLDRVYRVAMETFPDAEVDRRAVLGELARLNLEVFGRPADATEFAARAWQADPHEDQAWERLYAACRELGSFQPALQALDAVLEQTPDALDQVPLRLRKAGVLGRELLDVDGAAQQYQAVLEADPDNLEALDGLIALLRQSGPADQLLPRLRARLALTDEPAARVEMHKEIGSLLLDVLEEPSQAVTVYREALEEDPGDQDLYDLVASLSNRVGDLPAALEVLQRKAERFGGEPERDRELQHGVLAQLLVSDQGRDEARELAVALVERFGFDEPAVDCLEAELRRGEAVELLVSVLEKVLAQAGQHSRLAAVYDEALRHAPDEGTRLGWLRSVRDLQSGTLGEPLAAMRTQLMILAAGEVEEQEFERADQLAAQADATAELVLAYQEMCEALTDPDATATLSLRIARLYRDRLSDLDSATAWFRVVMENHPANREAFGALAELYEVTDAWNDLALLHENASGAAASPDEKVEHLRTACRIATDKLGDRRLERSLLRQLVELEPQDARAVATLEAGYLEAVDLDSLRWLYPLAIDHAADLEQRAALRCRYAKFLMERAEEYLEAIGQLEEALMDVPGLPDAREQLETILDREYLPRAHRKRILTRAVELLEGLYDQATDPERRVVLLEKKLQVTDEVDDQLDLLLKIGEVHDQGTADGLRGLDAFTRALKIRPADDHLHKVLLESARRHDLLENVVAVYSDVLEGSDDDQVLNLYLRRVGDLLRTELGRPDEATHHWAILNKRVPGDREVMGFLEGQYRATSMWRELLAILEERARFTDDPDEKGMLLLEAAELLEAHLEDEARLAAVYQQYLEVDPGSGEVADRLEALLLKRQDHQSLLAFYGERLAQTTEAHRRLELLKRDAQLRETALMQPAEAAGQLEEILSIDPANLYALAGLERLYTQLENHEGLYRVLGLRLAVVDDPEKRATLEIRQGELQLDHLGSETQSMKHLDRALELQPGNPRALELVNRLLGFEDTLRDAFQLLERTYHATGDHGALSALYQEAYSRSDDPSFKAAAARKAAQLLDESFQDRSASLVYYGRSLALSGDGTDLVERITELIARNDLFDDAAEMLPDLVADVGDEDQRFQVANELAGFFTGHGRPLAAIGFLEQARGARPEDEGVLRQLADLYQQAGEPGRVSELWEQLSDSSEIETAREYRFRLAEQRLGDAGTLDRGVAALAELYADGYRRDEIAARLGAVVDRMTNPATVLDLLEQHHRGREDHVALAEVLQVRLSLLEEAADQADLCRELGGLYGARLNQPQPAFHHLSRALLLDRRHVDALPELERLATRAGMYGELADLLEALAADEPEPAQAEEFLRSLLRIYESNLQSRVDAERVLARLVQLAPEDNEAMDRLLMLYEGAGKAAQWLELSWARVANETSQTGRDELHRAIAARARTAGDATSEARALEGLLESESFTPADQERLEELYAAGGQPQRVIAMLEKRLDQLTEPAELVEASVRLAQLRLELDGDDTTVVGLLERALDADPRHERALLLLAGVLRTGGMHRRLAEVLKQLVEVSEDRDQQVELLAQLALLTLESLEDKPGAARVYERVLELDPANLEATDALIELYGQTRDAPALLRTLNRKLVHETSQEGQLALLTRAARIQALELGALDVARETLANVLLRDPMFRDALVLSGELALRGGDRSTARTVFERLLEAGPAPAEKVELLRKLAGLHQESGDLDAAEDVLLRLLELAPEDAAPVDQLAYVYEKQQNWPALVEVLRKKAESALEPAARSEACRAVATLYLQRLSDEPRFEEWIRRAHEAEPEAEATLTLMLDFYRARGRVTELAPLLEEYVERLESEKRFAQYSRFAGELADLRVAAGDLERALETRKGIRCHDQQNHENLLGLGLLHYELGELDEALKTLQTMLLKQHQIEDATLKVGMFLALARITARQGNPKKALQYLQRVLALAPDNAEAGELKTELEKA